MNTTAKRICSSHSIYHTLGIIVNLPFIYLFTYSDVLRGSPPPPIQWVSGTPSSKVKGRSLKLTTDLHLVSRLTTEGALPSVTAVLKARISTTLPSTTVSHYIVQRRQNGLERTWKEVTEA